MLKAVLTTNRNRLIVFDISSRNMLDFLGPIMSKLPPSAYTVSAPYKLRKELSSYGFTFTTYKLLRSIRACKVFISASVFSSGPRNSTRIFLSHGYPVKFSHFPARFLKNFNIFLILGPRHKEWLTENLRLVGLDVKNFELLDLGFPRLEVLSNGVSQKEPAKNFLFAPSWEPELRDQRVDRKLFEALSLLVIRENIKILIRLHPVSLSADLQTSKILKSMVAEFATKFPDRFIDATTIPLERIIDDFSVLISDWSGISLEMLYLKKSLVCMPVLEVTSFYTDLYGDFQGSTEELLLDPLRNGGRNYSEVINLEVGNEVVAEDLFTILNSPPQRLFPREEYFSNPENSAQRIAEFITSKVL